MRSRYDVWAIVLLLGFLGQTVATNPAWSVNDHRSLAAVRGPIKSGAILTKPYGWLKFEEACAFGSGFATTLDRAKRSRDRVILRDFGDGRGNPYQQDLGLDCVPYSVGFD